MCSIPAQLNSDKLFSTRPLLPLTLKTLRPSPLDLFLKITTLLPVLMDGVQLSQDYRATMRRQFTFYHYRSQNKEVEAAGNKSKSKTNKVGSSGMEVHSKRSLQINLLSSERCL